MEEFIKDSDGDSGDRRRTLADRLEIDDKEFSAIRAKAPDLTTLIIEAATGTVPKDSQRADSGEKKTLRKHGRHWFKSNEGGRELADKVFRFDLWPKLETELMPFLNAVRCKVSLPEIDELPS